MRSIVGHHGTEREVHPCRCPEPRAPGARPCSSRPDARRVGGCEQGRSRDRPECPRPAGAAVEGEAGPAGPDDLRRERRGELRLLHRLLHKAVRSIERHDQHRARLAAGRPRAESELASLVNIASIESDSEGLTRSMCAVRDVPTTVHGFGSARVTSSVAPIVTGPPDEIGLVGKHGDADAAPASAAVFHFRDQPGAIGTLPPSAPPLSAPAVRRCPRRRAPKPSRPGAARGRFRG